MYSIIYVYCSLLYIYTVYTYKHSQITGQTQYLSTTVCVCSVCLSCIDTRRLLSSRNSDLVSVLFCDLPCIRSSSHHCLAVSWCHCDRVFSTWTILWPQRHVVLLLKETHWFVSNSQIIIFDYSIILDCTHLW